MRNGRRVREACQDIKVSMREAISLGLALDCDRQEEMGNIGFKDDDSK